LQTPKKEGGIQGVKFPLVADQTLTVSSNYEVLAGAFGYDEQGASVFEGSPVAYRGTFIIDKEGVVRSEIVNDLGLGRSVDETLRTLDALIHYEKHGEVCPAEWHEGQEALKPTFEDIAKYLSEK
jgi:peroxiredoxin (alkyl hydroperoxide reductase subunit C)